MRVLVAGGSGFVGRHLVTELLGRGRDVAVMTRRPGDRADGGRDVFGDVADPASLEPALREVDVAYYLVHTLDRADFASRDRVGAEHFADAARAAGVGRVVYLGGLGDDADDLSPHLRSRREVETILAERAPTIAVRAGIVIGQGSVSWEILCQLVERLPVMITPRWVETRTQPVALADVVTALAGLADLDAVGERFEIGTPEAVTYREMITAVARERGKRLLIVPVPVLTPSLSSRWLRLVTDVDLQTARTLVDSMTNEVVVSDRRLEQRLGMQPTPLLAAVRAALAERGGR